MLKALRGKRRYDEAPGDLLPLARRRKYARGTAPGSPRTKGWECLRCPRLMVNRGKVCVACLNRVQRTA